MHVKITKLREVIPFALYIIYCPIYIYFFSFQRVSSEGAPSSLPIIANPLQLSELPSPSSAQTTKKKSGTRKSTAQRASEREFTRQDKADALLSAIEKIVENNSLLREKIRLVEGGYCRS